MIRTDDHPERARMAIEFADGSRGIAITSDKAKADAAMMRFCVGVLTNSTTDPKDALRAVGALKSLADQFEQAAAGQDPQAQ